MPQKRKKSGAPAAGAAPAEDVHKAAMDVEAAAPAAAPAQPAPRKGAAKNKPKEPAAPAKAAPAPKKGQEQGKKKEKKEEPVPASQDADEQASSEEEGSGDEETLPAAKHPRLVRSLEAKTAAEADGKTAKWTNRQRTLVLSSRGISFRARHLLMDLRTLMPHSKKETKMDRKDQISAILPEICELRNCNNCVYFEMRKKQDLYMWVTKMPNGPSVKFLVENVHTMDELKLTGNSLKGSRPLLNFDAVFDTEPHLKLLKELLFQTFATPNFHPKSKPFFDHVLSFFFLDGRVWMRNYQINWKDADKELTEDKLVEIGPRCVLNPIRIFAGTFGGPTLFENAEYISPNLTRSLARREAAGKYKSRHEAKVGRVERAATHVVPADPVEEVFRESFSMKP